MFRVSAQSVAPLSREQHSFLRAQTYGANLAQFSETGIHWQWLSDVAPSFQERSQASAHGFDLNAIPAHWRWSDVGALASDMDSTMITVECIDEIADFAGVKPHVAQITEAAMRGELVFSDALRARVALLKNLPQHVLDRVFDERVRLSPGARDLVDAVHGVGGQSLLVSGGFTFFTQRLQAQLGLGDTLANTLEIEHGLLTGRVLGDIVDGQAKARAVAVLKAKIPAGKLLIAAGDGANDLPMMALADCSVAFRAKPVVREQAMISLAHCGLDAVRRLFPPNL